MGQEVKMTDYEEDDERVMEWEAGLPTADDLMPLSQSLVPPELASAFSISPEPCRSILDVNRASHNTLNGLRGQSLPFLPNDFKKFFDEEEKNNRDSLVVEGDEDNREGGGGADSRKLRRIDFAAEDADSAARTSKRPRLVWTPQLHKRFVDVVAHLGIKNAVPKTIMQLMNVDGLTRENVASHLQKYRLYLKRMQGLSNEDPSASDQLFDSTLVPQNLHESSGGTGNGQGNGIMPSVPIPLPYGTPVMPMPVFGRHLGIPPGAAAAYHGFESSPYSMLQQRDWPGNKFGSAVTYPHLTPNDK